MTCHFKCVSSASISEQVCRVIGLVRCVINLTQFKVFCSKTVSTIYQSTTFFSFVSVSKNLSINPFLNVSYNSKKDNRINNSYIHFKNLIIPIDNTNMNINLIS